MDHNHSNLQLHSQHRNPPQAQTLSSSLAIACSEWLNATECANITFAIGKARFATTSDGSGGGIGGGGGGGVGNATVPPDNLMEMDLEMDVDWPLERVVSMIVPVFFGIIGFAGLLGNALVILVVVANQQMRSTTNLLIINLAVSDILFVIFCVPFTATDYVLPEWPFGNLWCKFVQYMIVVTCHCSVYTLVLMSFDRFLAVVHPVTSMSLRTERNATLAIILAWILIITTAIPVALAHSVRIYQFHGHNYTACVFSSDKEVWSLLGFQVRRSLKIRGRRKEKDKLPSGITADYSAEFFAALNADAASGTELDRGNEEIVASVHTTIESRYNGSGNSTSIHSISESTRFMGLIGDATKNRFMLPFPPKPPKRGILKGSRSNISNIHEENIVASPDSLFRNTMQNEMVFDGNRSMGGAGSIGTSSSQHGTSFTSVVSLRSDDGGIQRAMTLPTNARYTSHVPNANLRIMTSPSPSADSITDTTNSSFATPPFSLSPIGESQGIERWSRVHAFDDVILPLQPIQLVKLPPARTLTIRRKRSPRQDFGFSLRKAICLDRTDSLAFPAFKPVIFASSNFQMLSFFLSSYVAPLTLICFLYMGMLARLWKSAPGCKPSAESRKGKRRVTRMVVVVVLAFAVCWLPIHVILVLKALNLYGSSHITVIIQIISHVLAYTNSCINPILYAFLSDNFRKAFRKIVWCGSPPPIITNQQVTKTTRTATGNGTSNIDML